MRGKLEPAELYHEVLEHRWFLSERPARRSTSYDAAQSYISTVLHRLPDEAVAFSTEETMVGLANPFDPSQGFADGNDEKPYDPWEDNDEGPGEDEEPAAAYLDIAALRARTSKPTLRD